MPELALFCVVRILSTLVVGILKCSNLESDNSHKVNKETGTPGTAVWVHKINTAQLFLKFIKKNFMSGGLELIKSQEFIHRMVLVVSRIQNYQDIFFYNSPGMVQNCSNTKYRSCPLDFKYIYSWNWGSYLLPYQRFSFAV